MSQTDPQSPFLTLPYVTSMREDGRTPWAIGLTNEGRIQFGCFGFSRRGLRTSEFVIPSLPAASNDAFWGGIVRLCRQRGFEHLSLQTFGSHLPGIPIISGECARQDRREFVLDLRDDHLWQLLDKKHRASVKLASEAKVEVRSVQGWDGARIHARLMRESAGRRGQLADAADEIRDASGVERLLRRKAARLYVVFHENEAISSACVLMASRGAYLLTAGNAARALRVGASHFVLHEISKQLQGEGMETFNLGGTDLASESLARFKRRFGAREIVLAHVEARPGLWIIAKLNSCVRRVVESLEDRS